MKGFKTTEDNTQAIERKKQFETEFNRFYFTKRYVEAFDLCIKNLSDTDTYNKSFIRNKAMFVIKKLTNRIELSDKSRINTDWVIDALINQDNSKMAVNANNIKLGNTAILITENDKIKISGKQRIHPAFSILLSLVIAFGCVFLSGIICCLCEDLGFEGEVGGVLSFLICVPTFLFIMIKIHLSFRHRIRNIATAILEEYYNH